MILLHSGKEEFKSLEFNMQPQEGHLFSVLGDILLLTRRQSYSD